MQEGYQGLQVFLSSQGVPVSLSFWNHDNIIDTHRVFLPMTISVLYSVCLVFAHSELFSQLFALNYDTKIVLLDDHVNRIQVQTRLSRRLSTSKRNGLIDKLLVRA